MKKISAASWSILLAGVFVVLYLSLSLQRYQAHLFRGDITAYAQGMWNTLHGHPFASTFNYSVHEFWGGEGRTITADNSNIMGIHFNPILILFLPVYALAPQPTTLLFVQAIVLALSSVFIYAVALAYLHKRPLALLVQFSYLLHTALVSAIVSEFHAYALATLPAAAMIWAYQKRRFVLYGVCLFLLLAVQENAALVALAFGGYLLVSGASRKLGAATALLAVLSLLVTTKMLIPLFSPMGKYLFDNAYGSPLGGSYLEIFAQAVRHPGLFIQTVLTRDNLVYLAKILLPTLPFIGFAPLAALAALGVLAPNLLSSAQILKSLSMHYEAAALPLVYFAYILGLATCLRRVKQRWFGFVIGACMLIPLGAQYKWLTSHTFSPRCIWACGMYNARDHELDDLLALIPAGASVSTQDYLSVHLSSRAKLYLFPVAAESVDYLALSKGDEAWPVEPDVQRGLIADLRENPAYSIRYESAHYILFAKSSSIK